MPDTASSSHSLQRDARDLAHAHEGRVCHRRRARAGRLHRVLEERTQDLLASLHSGDPVKLRRLPHIQWLLDNSHVLRATLSYVRKSLPSRYYRQLPMVPSAREAGYQPRVTAIVDTALGIVGVPIEMKRIERFCSSYQSVAPLTIGELWAIPAMLRIRLMQQIIDVATRASGIGSSEATATELDELTSVISGSITSLRSISAYKWEDFVERMARVDRILAKDPSRSYRHMEFDTRNAYRSTIEKIARIGRVAEWDVAEAALQLASCAAKRRAGVFAQHVGYYLIDDGVHELFSLLRIRGRGRKVRAYRPFRAVAYLTGVVTTALAFLFALAVWLVSAGTPGHLSVITIVAAAVPSLVLSSTLLNNVLSRLRKPRPLPKLDFSDGIPAAHRAIVAIPAMLSDHDVIDEMLRTLELNYLGNDDAELQFAVLTDHRDADSAELPDDEAMLEHAVTGIAALNQRYGSDSTAPFVLMHRRRRWNEAASVWMGWERKRGKLAEFNEFLRGSEKTDFTLQSGELRHASNVRYVITLDADTVLPTGAAARLAGTLAHPLNRPVFDGFSHRVERGYSILQPRVETNPVTSSMTPFARFYSGDVSLDLYTHAVSNVYQDLFARGIFAGKGIYDVDAFRKAIQSQIPENRVLSHDLLEGLYGRAGLVTDVILLEDYPTTLLAYLARVHRWIRGDWQLLPWLFNRSTVKVSGNFRPGIIGRWQITDNLVRSLFAPSLILLFSIGWLLLPVNTWLFTLVLMLTPGMAVLLHALVVFRVRAWRWGTAGSSIKKIMSDAGRDLAHWILVLAFLPMEALVALDAIVRTLYRLSSRRQRLLEWTTAADAARSFEARGLGLRVQRQLWPAPAWAIINLAAIVSLQIASLPAAAALLLLWGASPVIAAIVSRRRAHAEPALDTGDRLYLRRIARGTWRFFEQQVTPANHWLPPDNIQLEPVPLVAPQTSPSNIGFALLSTIAACDLGYTATRECLQRLQQSIDSIDGLEKHRGHLFNWYSLPACKPLPPRYVSTVDSGNLIGALITVREWLLETGCAPLTAESALAGIGDDLALLRERLTGGKTGPEPGVAGLLAAITRIEEELHEPASPELALQAIAGKHSHALNTALLGMIGETDVSWTNEEIGHFRSEASSLSRRADAALRELQELAPWRLWTSDDYALPAAWGESWAAELPRDAPLRSLPHRIDCARQVLSGIARTDDGEAAREHLAAINGDLHKAHQNVDALLAQLTALAATIDRMIEETDFRFLYDRERELFHVGYRAESGELDSSYYDLLASEARLASFIAIAKGDVPPRHWVHLGRPLTSIGGLRILLSWSATAFEYLMPQLLMQAPRFGLIAQSCRGAIKQQRRFGQQHGIPWGVSESGFYHFDQHGRYQYQAFGIPRLGLKWDQGERLVVSPYASILALPFDTAAVMQNARAIEKLGGRGELGFFEALDFGLAQPEKGGRPKIVRSHMAHHQGMILTTLANVLTGKRMIERFHRDSRIAKVEYLLYEKLPLRAETQTLETFEAPMKRAEPALAGIETWTQVPGDKPVAALANAQLAARVTTLGGGSLSWHGIAATRWRSHMDGLAGGSRLYIRDLDRNVLWSSGLAPGDPAVTVFASPDQVEIRDTRHDLLTRQQIVVPPFANVEIRRLHLTNDGREPRRLLVCNYSEPVLGDASNDARHPAFSKMFVECEFDQARNMLVFRRRPLNPAHAQVILACTAVAAGADNPALRFETDRREFMGRGGSEASPAALSQPAPVMRCLAEASLDPVAACAIEVTVPPGQSVQCAFLTAVGEDEVKVLRELEHLDSMAVVDWTISDAKRHAQHDLSLLEVTSTDVRRSYEMLGCLLSPAPRHNLTEQATAIRDAQAELWRHGISGDNPVVLVVLDNRMPFTRIESLMRALSVCEARGAAADIIFLDESESAYAHPTQDRLQRLIRQALGRTATNRRFKSFVIPAHNLRANERPALELSAQLVFDLRHGDFAPQLARALERPAPMPGFLAQPSKPVQRIPTDPVGPLSPLEFDNGFGGLTEDHREYVIFLDGDRSTPAPWCNILANPQFGTLVSERGSSNSWFENSSELGLTTWSNDAVLNRTGEAVYLRDEETGAVWSPMPGPAPDRQPYLVRHGIGYTRFEHRSEGLDQSTDVFVDPEHAVKYVRIKVQNRWPRNRRLTLTYAAEWRLGSNASEPGLHLLPDWDESGNTLYVRNAFAANQPGVCAFLTSSEEAHGVTCDGDEFLGPLRSWRRPGGLDAIGLAGRTVPCAHPMAVHQVHVSLAEGQSREIHFALGAGRDRRSAARLSAEARNAGKAEAVFRQQNGAWSQLLDGCRIATPVREIDALVNAFLPYQVVSSRLWGRIGLYQASGATGFRDQLQDVMAMLHLRPAMAAEQIQKAAAAQFEEGDVLHWWHSDPLRGVRTRCSDDLLWLPYTVAQYLAVTRDLALLDAEAPFLSAPVLADDEHERYAEFAHGKERGTIYEHCWRAIEARMTHGPHGLPPIGSGDWNDGLSRVGLEGRGESVWMAWFLIEVCRRFEPVCRLRGDVARARTLRQLRRRLHEAVESSAWSGGWYVRGFYDDGSVLGGPERTECRIDLNAQTWAVLSGGDKERQAQALAAAVELLADDETQLVRLLTPPFQHGRQDPGYIKSYPPGVRENGGQYNHAATWAVMAAADAGDAELAMRWLSWINPLTRSRTTASSELYRIEPYVVAADVYSCSPFAGRGGWSWYTGTAAWLYRVIIEKLLGIERRGERLHINPRLPADWPAFAIEVRHAAAHYTLHVHEPSRVTPRTILIVEDGGIVPGAVVRLQSSGNHEVHVYPDEASRASAESARHQP